MSYLVNYAKWRSVFEAEDKSGIPDKYKVLLVGATSAPISNKAAFVEIKEALSAPSLESITLTEDQALSKKANPAAGESPYSAIKRPTVSKDYLKIGNLVLDGAQKKVVSISIDRRMILASDASWEASGNGLLALARAIKYAKSFNIGQTDDPIIIALNLGTDKNPQVVLADYQSGLENAKSSWLSAIEILSVATGAVVPNKENHSSGVESGRSMLAEKNQDNINTLVNRRAVPLILNDVDKKSLQELNPIQVDLSTLTNKQKKAWDADLEKVISDFTKTYAPMFINAYADRFIKYLENKSGIDRGIFAPLINKIEEWRKTELTMIQTYVTESNNMVKRAFTVVRPTEGVPGKGTEAAVSTKELKVGGI
jgi:hypothetical protein